MENSIKCVKLTDHFALGEFLATSHGSYEEQITAFSSDPSYLSHVKGLAVFLETARKYYGRPIHINSGFRSPVVNERVGGAKNSNHLKGLAADIRYPDSFPQIVELFEAIVQAEAELGFDLTEIILYKNFIHIAL